MKTLPKEFIPPIKATHHCRHYDYKPGLGDHDGPQCAKGLDNRQSGGARRCMPSASFPNQEHCPKREEFTAKERAEYKEFQVDQTMRLMAVIPLIPASHRPKEDQQFWGKRGSFKCPCCQDGTVKWSRSPNNGHIWAMCDTPNCLAMGQ
jgi:hypothetical protein